MSRQRFGGRCACLGLLSALLLWSGVALGQYRRPGLGGRWTHRQLTAPMNSLTVVLGPGQPALMGQRYADQVVDGGGQYVHLHPQGDAGVSALNQDQWFARAGVIFGLTEDWEAGALFLPFQLHPKFAFSGVTAYGTRGFRHGPLDLGIRMSIRTPDSISDDAPFWVSLGMPLLYRAGSVRLDAGVFFPLAVREWWLGVNAPVRATVNLGPSFWLGLETGFSDPRLDEPNDGAVPLGALAGYTRVIGANVFDLTANFTYSEFWLVDAPDGLDTLQTNAYRVTFGISMSKLVK